VVDHEDPGAFDDQKRHGEVDFLVDMGHGWRLKGLDRRWRVPGWTPWPLTSETGFGEGNPA
jgi:hypothetical protein